MHKRFWLCLMIGQNLLSEIKTIKSLQEAAGVLQSLDQQALVIFDVDETLIRASQGCFSFKKLLSDLRFNFDFQEYVDSIHKLNTEYFLIESDAPRLIRELQSKGIRVIALTAIYAGPYGIINSLEEWRFKQLYELGIDFSMHNPTHMVLTKLPFRRKSYPVVYKGILVTACSCTKGRALEALIKELVWKPSKVVFFDDQKHHVQSVSKQMSELGISCVAYHYQVTETLV